MDQTSAFVSLGVALGVGLLIGFERQQATASEHVPERAAMGGARTYPLVSLAGALAAIVSRSLGVWFAALAFGAVAALVAISYREDVRKTRDHGLSSEMAMLVTFLLGVLAATDGLFESVREQVLVVVACAIVVTFVLSLKPPLHALADKATKDDVVAALKFLLVALVVVPLLPDREMGPFGALNPRKLGLLVALLTGIGFAGYIAMRAMGAGHGLVVTGLFGGLVSSTAVTLAAARHVRKSAKAIEPGALAVVIASTVMGARVLVVSAAFNTAFLRTLALPLALVIAVGAVASFALWFPSRGRGDGVALDVKNPVELWSAVQMTLVVAAVLVAQRAAAQWLGPGGVYATSALAGTVDVDAVTVSMAGQATASDAAVPATAVLVAVASNTAAKTAIATVVGSREFGRRLLVPAAATVCAAGAGIAWLWISRPTV